MAQLSIRLPDDLAQDLKATAREHGRSVNALVVDAVRAMVDPEHAGDEAEQLRERLRRAGLLHIPYKTGVEPPPPERVAEAMKAAGRGKSLSEYVIEGRGPR